MDTSGKEWVLSVIELVQMCSIFGGALQTFFFLLMEESCERQTCIMSLSMPLLAGLISSNGLAIVLLTSRPYTMEAFGRRKGCSNHGMIVKGWLTVEFFCISPFVGVVAKFRPGDYN
jgi:hypothetical protein